MARTLGAVFAVFLVLPACSSLSKLRHKESDQVGMVSQDLINGLYVRTFGKPGGLPLLFIHGGPGNNSSSFEVSFAPRLAAEGYYVIVYDQRGQGRSTFSSGMDGYRYSIYADDILRILNTLHVLNPILLAHSHGGTIAAKFDMRYPNVAKKIILIDAPIDNWGLFSDIESNCMTRFKERNDKEGEKRLKHDFEILREHVSTNSEVAAQRMTDSIEDIFQVAVQCGGDGLYSPNTQNDQSQEDYEAWATFYKKHIPPEFSTHPKMHPINGFILNENYIHLDYSNWVKMHREKFFGIYGAEDGLFTKQRLAAIRSLLTKSKTCEKFFLIAGASHDPFMDQWELSKAALKQILSCL